MFERLIKEDGRREEVEEIAENLVILIGRGHKEMNVGCEDEWSEVIIFVNNIVASKAKDYPSLSNKSIFKFMDMVDCLSL